MARRIRFLLTALALSFLARPAFAQESLMPPAPPPPPPEQAVPVPSAEDFIGAIVANMAGPQPPPGAMGTMMAHMPVEMTAHLNAMGCPLMALHGPTALTDDQYDKLYALKESLMDQMGAPTLQLHQAERHLHDALTATTLDMKQIQSLQGQIATLKAGMSKMMTDKLVEGAQILTPEQRHEIRLHMERAALGGMHGGWGGPHMMHHHPMPGMEHHHHEGPPPGEHKE